MALMEIRLDSGQVVNLGALLVLETYSNLLEGTPNRANNEVVMQNHIRTIEALWGPKPAHSISPTSRINKAGQEELLPILLALDLSSDRPVHDPRMSGSHLVLLQFFDKLPSDLFADSQEVVRTINWVKHAADFEW